MTSLFVLVGDSDTGYAELVGELLRRHSHKVVIATSRDSCRRFLDRSVPDLILLSSMGPGVSLPEFVRELSGVASDIPIIALTEDLGPSEVAGCLAAGADDCLQKPFHPAELIARVETVTRRFQPRSTTRDQEQGTQSADQAAELTPFLARAESDPALPEQTLSFDHIRERAYYRGTDLNCTELEYQILGTLVEMRGEVASHALLNERVWGYPNMADGALVKPHISSIRRKLSKAGGDRRFIRTIYGAGYAIALDLLSPHEGDRIQSTPEPVLMNGRVPCNS